MSKIFGITILFFGLLAVITTYEDVSPFWFDGNQSEQIKMLWEQDLELLVRNRSLPKEWIKVSEVKYFPLTDSVKELLTKIQPPLSQHENGSYRMEVTIDDWKDDSDYGLMIQYQIFDMPSDNLVWELGRTLIIADSKIIKKPGIKEKSETKSPPKPIDAPEQKPSRGKTK